MSKGDDNAYFSFPVLWINKARSSCSVATCVMVIRVSVVAFQMAPETTEQGDFIELWDRSRRFPY